MSLKHFLAVRDSGLLKGATYAVAQALAVRANEGGICWPSMDLLAREARVCKRSARQATRTLEAQGLLTIDRKSRTTNSFRLELEAFEAAGRNRHLRGGRRPLSSRRSEAPTGRQTPPKRAESPAPKDKGTIRNLHCARKPEIQPHETFQLLDLLWSWETEGAFAVAATQIAGSGVTDDWFSRGKPTFVIFADPLRTQGAGSAGLSITWCPAPGDPSTIEKVLAVMGFDEDALWPWSAFIDRMSSCELPPLEPVPVRRLGWAS